LPPKQAAIWKYQRRAKIAYRFKNNFQSAYIATGIKAFFVIIFQIFLLGLLSAQNFFESFSAYRSLSWSRPSSFLLSEFTVFQ